MAYDAFISYSHAADHRLAAALQRGLERLGRAPYQPRALHVFRDDTSLEASPELWAPIAAALEDATWCVVLCSPEAVASKWVDREVSHWLATKSAQHMLLVVTGGEIKWDTARQDFTGTSTAVPRALYGAVASEPRSVSLEWARDDSHLDLRNARFRSAIAEIAAPMHGIPRDQLESEDLHQQRRALRLARGAITGLLILLLLSAAAGFVALRQRSVARRSARAANARSLAAESTNQLGAAHTATALLLAAEAERLDDTPIGRRALLASLTAEPSLRHDLATGADGVSNAAFSSDGRILAAQTTDSRVVFWSLPSGNRMPLQVKVKDASELGPMQFFDHDTLFAIQRYDTASKVVDSVEVRSMRTGDVVRRVNMSFPWTSSTAAPFIADGNSNVIRVFNAYTGQLVRSLPAPGGDQLPAVALSPDGTVLASAQVDPVEGNRTYAEVIDVWDVTNGTWVSQCRIDAGGEFNGAFAQPPVEPMILDLAVNDNASSVRSALSGGTRAVVADCSLADTGDPDVHDVEIPTVPSAPVVAVSDDQRTIATRDTKNGTLRLFDTSGKPVAAEVRANTAFPGNFVAAQFSPDGRFVIPTDSADGDVKVWSISNARPPLTNRVGQLLRTRVLATSPDGRVLVVIKDSTTSFIDRSTGASLGGLPWVPDAVAISADDSIAVAATNPTSGSRPGLGSFTVVDLRTQQRRYVGIGELACAREVGALALARDDADLFVVCGDTDYVVAELDISGATTRLVASSKFAMAGAEQQIAVSPDGRFVVAGGFVHFGSGFQLFEVKGAQLRSLTSENVTWGLSAAAFAPDGRTFATAFGNGRTQLWRIGSSGAVPTELDTPGAEHDAIAFSADSSELAIGGCPATDIWSLDPVTQIGSLNSGAGCAAQLAFSGNTGSLLAIASSTIQTSSSSSNTTEWDVDPRNWVHDACLIVGRNLTKKEWSEFLPNASYRKTCPSEPS